jgi:hypothetical protein
MSNSFENLIGVTGYGIDKNENFRGVKQVGKDYFTNFLKDRCSFSSDISFSQYAHADPLKNILCDYYMLNRDFYDKVENKQIPIKDLQNMTYRKLLEVFGTNVIRKGLPEHLPKLKSSLENMWVNKLISRLKRKRLSQIEKLTSELFDLSDHELFEISELDMIPRLGYNKKELNEAMEKECKSKLPPPPVCSNRVEVITDVRFPNEYEKLKDLGACIVQIRRKMDIVSNSHDQPCHSSNMHYPEMVPNEIIENDGTIKFENHILQSQCYCDLFINKKRK